MAEAPVPPRFRTTPEAFPAGETADNYARDFGGGDKSGANLSEGACTEESLLSDFNGLASSKTASAKKLFAAAYFSSPVLGVMLRLFLVQGLFVEREIRGQFTQFREQARSQRQFETGIE